MAIKRLEMKRGSSLQGGWVTPGIDFEFLCFDGVREIFDVLDSAEEIVFCVSYCKVRGATEAKMIHDARCSCCSMLELADGTLTRVLQDKFAEWLPAGTFWFWIEY